MNEFEEKDYGHARSTADAVKKNADEIMNIFNDVDSTMNQLYGANWESSGADNAKDRYNEIRKNYEVFYNRVVTMRNHIYNVTAANEEADAQASNTVTQA